MRLFGGFIALANGSDFNIVNPPETLDNCCPGVGTSQTGNSIWTPDFNCHLKGSAPWNGPFPAPSSFTRPVCSSWDTNWDFNAHGGHGATDINYKEDPDLKTCGYNRAFPWKIKDGKQYDTVDQTLDHCKFGMFDCTDDVMSNNYVALKIGRKHSDTTGSIIHSLQHGPMAASGKNEVFGEVTLGAVCYLWIPVNYNHIASVKIAGVHTSGGGTNWNEDHKHFSVFTDAAVCASSDCSNELQRAGTAYAFTVLDPTYGMNPKLPLPAPQMGSSIENTPGGLFDVTVEFNADYCFRHWTYNAGYNDTPQTYNQEFTKHFQASSCGCCGPNGVSTHDSTNYIEARGCNVCTNCHDINKTWRMDGFWVTNSESGWPNAGAWAAHYSFITCADDGYMIYEKIDGTSDLTDPSGTTTSSVSVYHTLFRHPLISQFEKKIDQTTGDLTITGNIRQSGSQVKMCPPGQLQSPNSDPNGDPYRCTWNWNFSTFFTYPISEPFVRDSWFQSGTRTFDSWRKAPQEWGGMTGYLAESFDFKVVFQMMYDNSPEHWSGQDTKTRSFKMFPSKYFNIKGSNIDINGHEWDVRMSCREPSADGNGPIIDTLDPSYTFPMQEDVFPDCYIGDEIQFEYIIYNSIEAGLWDLNTDRKFSPWYSYVDGYGWL